MEKVTIENQEENMQIITQPIYATGEQMAIEVIKKLADMTSDYQKISFVETKDFGRCLIIDDVVQTAETDHEIYDAEMLRKMKPTDRELMVLGGGDGYIAQMAVAKNENVHVEIADLDEMVVEGCKKYLDQKVFDDQRVTVHIGDALAYMREGAKQYDGIVCDLTDAPVGAKEVEEFERFFEEVIALASACIRGDGWMSFQSGASVVSGEYINSVEIVEQILKKYFATVERSDIMIPSYGEKCAFLFAQK